MSSIRSLLADAEERFLVPMLASRMPGLWRELYAGLTFPFFLSGTARRWEIELDGGSARLTGVGPAKRLRALERITGPLGPAMSAGSGEWSRWNPSTYQRESADLIAVSIHPAAAPRFQRAGWVIMPDVVRWVGSLHSIPPLQPNRSMRHDLHRIERFGGAIEPAGSTGDWQEFFGAMVEPQARGRFGESAWIPRHSFRRTLTNRGTLLFVTRQGQRVAGITLLRCSNERVWIPLIAIRNGDPSLLNEGAMAAAVAGALDWARSHGYRTIDAGRTSPMINDGVHRSKVKWGYRPVPDPMAHLLALRIDRRCAPLVAALAREPFLQWSAASLHRFVTPPEHAPQEIVSPALAASGRAG